MTIIDFLYGLGIFQGITLLAVLLPVRGPKRQSNLVMSVLILVLVLALLHNWLVRLNYFLQTPTLALAHLPLDYLIGPLLYFYGLSLVQQPFRKVQLLHFLPAALAVVPTVAFNIMPDSEQVTLLKFVWYRELTINDTDMHMLPLSAAWEVWIKNALHGTLYMLHVGTYCLLLHRVIQSNRARLLTHYSSIEQKDLNWLRNLNIALIVYLVAYLVFNRIPRLTGSAPTPSISTPSLIITATIQIVALVSLWQPELIHGRRSIQQDDKEPDSPTPPEQTTTSELPATDVEVSKPASDTKEEPTEEAELKLKYKRSGLTPETAQEYRIKVMQVMQEKKLFLESELTLNELAEQAGIPAHQLSEVLNGQLNQNFYSFVNDYRVQYAKELLIHPDTRDMPIVELAFEAGFRSKSSFYDAFKKATSMTPTQFKKQSPELAVE